MEFRAEIVKRDSAIKKLHTVDINAPPLSLKRVDHSNLPFKNLSAEQMRLELGAH